MKYCPYCRCELKFSDPKFCPECGASLTTMATSNKADSYEVIPKEEIEVQTIEKEETEPTPFSSVESEIETQKFNVYELGNKLEEVVERIYQSKGYSTDRRHKIKGESGTYSEIDILARKDQRVLAIECKNYSSVVGIEELRNFSEKLRDLGLSGKGVFVSLKGLSQGAEDFAQFRHIETMDSSELAEKWLAISVGRTESVKGQSLILEYTLPINVSFSQATTIKLTNKEKVKVSDAEIIFHPYFFADYSFKTIFKDPTRKLHKFTDNGTVYIDALDGKVLNHQPEKGLGLLKAVKNLTSAASKAENARTNKLLKELTEKSPLKKYELRIEENYHANKLKPAISVRQAITAALEFIIEKNTTSISYIPRSQREDDFPETRYVTFTPKRQDIRISRKDVVIVPRWSIEFETSNSVYRREVLACSGTVIEDTMAFCPSHFRLGSIDFSKRSSVAVCEKCGKALCEEHIQKCALCGKWLCNEHSFDCEVCQNRFCKDHEIVQCQTCKGNICYSCVNTCPICNMKYSPKHSLKCDICGRETCPNCITISGLIRKNKTCKVCKQ